MGDYEVIRQLHAGCMVCGTARGEGALGLAFEPDGAGGVRAAFRASDCHQGYDGLLHGGMISTLLDAAMVHCLFARGVVALTAEMTVRFLHQVPIGTDVEVAAALIDARHGLYRVGATLSGEGAVLARASGKFRSPRP